jgi:signal transduction histidine kinase
LSRQFLRPLSDLTKAITAMKYGDLNQRVQVRTHDELGQLAETFNQMSAEIHRANQLRRQMTADIAHDLRTPLMVISGYLEALHDGTLPPTPERFEAMNNEAILLKRLVDDLRTLSLADSGELKLALQSVQPRDLLEQVRQSFEPIAHERHIALRLEADLDLPDVRMDRERMVQVLGNLVTNALRYTPVAGVITLGAHQGMSGVRLIVSDTGSGIEQDKLPYIFERFYRTEAARSQNEGESGLGLAIAKSIVEAHGGQIAAESRVGKGTSILITLQPVVPH